MAIPISVVIPVGPDPHYLEWLDECLDSIIANDPEQIIIVDDMQELSGQWLGNLHQKFNHISYIHNLWLCGCAMSWNFGVATAENDLVFLAGSDDIMLPGCLQSIYDYYEANQKQWGYYSVSIEYDNGEVQSLPCNAAAVSKRLWKETGGFEIAAFAAPDAYLISQITVHLPSRLFRVREGVPLYKVRKHAYQDTGRTFHRFFQPVHDIRNIGTATWTKPEWTDKLKW